MIKQLELFDNLEGILSCLHIWYGTDMEYPSLDCGVSKILSDGRVEFFVHNGDWYGILDLYSKQLYIEYIDKWIVINKFKFSGDALTRKRTINSGDIFFDDDIAF